MNKKIVYKNTTPSLIIGSIISILTTITISHFLLYLLKPNSLKISILLLVVTHIILNLFITFTSKRTLVQLLNFSKLNKENDFNLKQTLLYSCFECLYPFLDDYLKTKSHSTITNTKRVLTQTTFFVFCTGLLFVIFNPFRSLNAIAPLSEAFESNISKIYSTKPFGKLEIFGGSFHNKSFYLMYNDSTQAITQIKSLAPIKIDKSILYNNLLSYLLSIISYNPIHYLSITSDGIKFDLKAKSNHLFNHRNNSYFTTIADTTYFFIVEKNEIEIYALTGDSGAYFISTKNSEAMTKFESSINQKDTKGFNIDFIFDVHNLKNKIDNSKSSKEMYLNLINFYLEVTNEIYGDQPNSITAKLNRLKENALN